MNDPLKELMTLALSGELSREAATSGLIMLYEAGVDDRELETVLIAAAGDEGHADALDALHARMRIELEDLAEDGLHERVWQQVRAGVRRLRGVIRWLDGLQLPEPPALSQDGGLAVLPTLMPVALRGGESSGERCGWSFLPDDHDAPVQVELLTRGGAPLRIVVRHDTQACGCDGLVVAIARDGDQGTPDLARVVLGVDRGEAALELPREVGAAILAIRDEPLKATWEFPIEAEATDAGE